MTTVRDGIRKNLATFTLPTQIELDRIRAETREVVASLQVDEFERLSSAVALRAFLQRNDPLPMLALIGLASIVDSLIEQERQEASEVTP